VRALFAIALVPLASCAGFERSAESGQASSSPYVLVLGTAQDAGLPQIACQGERCRAARADPTLRRLASSILLVDPRSGRRWLFDATPDVREQIELAHGHPGNHPADAAPSALGGRRPRLFDGVFLTHAHIGHYAGLVHLGPEAYAEDQLPVHTSPRMAAFLEGAGPWSLLVDAGHISLQPFTPGEEIALAEDLSVVPLAVPHRDEFSDTMGFLIRGPDRSLLYLPDIDKWDLWERPIEDVIAGVEVALVDGTFFADGEVPGRSMAEIRHPFIIESIDRLGGLPAEVRARVSFIHLNHTNPACDLAREPDGEAARLLEAAGMGVAREGDLHRL